MKQLMYCQGRSRGSFHGHGCRENIACLRAQVYTLEQELCDANAGHFVKKNIKQFVLPWEHAGCLVIPYLNFFAV